MRQREINPIPKPGALAGIIVPAGPRCWSLMITTADEYRVLAWAGFRVLEASTGQEALQKLAEHHPALVVLDVKLPDIDGFTVCRAIKGDPGSGITIVLPVSAY